MSATTTKRAEVEQLRADLAELTEAFMRLRENFEQAMADLTVEVRTERLVVVHPIDGRELITTTVNPESVVLRLGWLPESDPMSTDAVMVSMMTSDPLSASEVYVSAAGDLVGWLSGTSKTDEKGELVTEGYLHLERRPDDHKCTRAILDAEGLRIDTT